MTYSLNTIVLEPLSKNKPKNAVILCHGYGGDGNDVITVGRADSHEDEREGIQFIDAGDGDDSERCYNGIVKVV